MKTEITEVQNGVEIHYHADNGGEASAVAIGMSATEVESRADAIIEAHSLREQATSNGQS